MAFRESDGDVRSVQLIRTTEPPKISEASAPDED
jgi:hypothetical protein